MKETHLRTVVKSISFRILATMTTMFIVYMFTRKAALSLGVGLVETVFKLVLYYYHERTWLKISWGKQKDLESK